jgi:hypothetical protein
MTFYERYLAGETKQVYEEIADLGDKAFLPHYLPDIMQVLTETFQRVSYNLDVIYEELTQINYLFKTQYEYNFEKPLHKPLINTVALLQELENAIKPFGYMPLSLACFYKTVGGVNFVWDYDANEDILWEMADPMQVTSLDALLESVTDESWSDEMTDYAEDEDFGCAFLGLSADALHKDNISGGPAYAIQIATTPQVDSNFMNEPNSTTFIGYLRICFEHGGFPGMALSKTNADYNAFLERVKSRLKLI